MFSLGFFVGCTHICRENSSFQCLPFYVCFVRYGLKILKYSHHIQNRNWSLNHHQEGRRGEEDGRSKEDEGRRVEESGGWRREGGGWRGKAARLREQKMEEEG